jgi:hypothetical protein
MLRLLKTSRPGRSATLNAPREPRCPGAVRIAKSRVLHRLREELGDLRR